MTAARLLGIAGKGGVGKTTVAAATALAAAAGGQRTLVVSLDRAHSLGDVLGVPLGPQPLRVADQTGLWAMELDPQSELRRHWQAIQSYLGRFLTYLGLGGAVAEEMAVLPGLEELLAMAGLADLLAEGRYDLVVADFAPTADSLRFLSLPDLLHGALGRWIDLDHKAVRLLRPFQSRLSIPVPEEAVYEGISDLGRRLDGLRAILSDPTRAVLRLVMLPEQLALAETRRALAYLHLFGLSVDAVIVNRLFPPDAPLGYLAPWAAVHARVLAEARAQFADLTILTLPAQPTEALGATALRLLAAQCYADHDPAAFYPVQPPVRFQQDGGSTLLTLSLPHASGSQLDLRRREQELLVTVGAWRRAIPLPDALAGRAIQSARLIAGRLEIVFAPEARRDEHP